MRRTASIGLRGRQHTMCPTFLASTDLAWVVAVSADVAQVIAVCRAWAPSGQTVDQCTHPAAGPSVAAGFVSDRRRARNRPPRKGFYVRSMPERDLSTMRYSAQSSSLTRWTGIFGISGAAGGRGNDAMGPLWSPGKG